MCGDQVKNAMDGTDGLGGIPGEQGEPSPTRLGDAIIQVMIAVLLSRAGHRLRTE